MLWVKAGHENAKHGQINFTLASYWIDGFDPWTEFKPDFLCWVNEDRRTYWDILKIPTNGITHYTCLRFEIVGQSMIPFIEFSTQDYA